MSPCRYTIQATSLRKNSYYYHGYFVGANTLFGYFIPFVLLVVLNVQIVRILNAPPTREDEMVAQSIRASRCQSVRSVSFFIDTFLCSNMMFLSSCTYFVQSRDEQYY